MMRVAIVDYGVGNLRSVERALARAGAEAVITPDPRVVAGSDGVVLPGVGAFAPAAALLLGSGLGDAVREAAVRGRPVLGVCLGSQLIAAVLGAKVYPGRKKEIGWHRVDLTNAVKSDPLWKDAPRSFRGFHWHGDIFDLPRGATLLASSALTANQAFRYGRNAYAILFHMEITSAQVRTMVETFSSELLVTGLNPRAITLNAHLHLPVLHSIGQTVFTRWAALLS